MIHLITREVSERQNENLEIELANENYQLLGIRISSRKKTNKLELDTKFTNYLESGLPSRNNRDKVTVIHAIYLHT